jgi:hypothetical protein
MGSSSTPVELCVRLTENQAGAKFHPCLARPTTQLVRNEEVHSPFRGEPLAWLSRRMVGAGYQVGEYIMTSKGQSSFMFI